MAPPPRWCFVPLHPASVEALFSEALRLNMRLIAGKVMMDRHVPDYLCETAGRATSRPGVDPPAGISAAGWHAITPRFAPTSTPGCWRRCSACGPSFPTRLQTHLSENREEIAPG